MYRFIAASLLATGALANMHHMMPENTPAPVAYEPAPVAYEPAPVMYNAPAMTKEVTTTTVMKHEQTAPAEMAMEHSSAMEGEAPAVTSHAMMEGEAPQPTQYAAVMTHTVIVGGDAGLEYTPQSLMANVGDVIMFHFMKQNHSVTESTFAKPCVKKAGGIDSGLMPNPNNTIVPPPAFMFTVQDMEPTWWYCKQRTGNHCGKGMVFAINPTPEKSYEKFQSEAMVQNGTVTPPSTTAAAPPSEATYAPGSTVTLIGGGEESKTMVETPASSVEATPVESAPVEATPIESSPVEAAPSAIATGWNSGSGNSCQCSCFCGVGAYPQGWGIGNMGGMGGVLPAPWASSAIAAEPAQTGGAGGYYKS